MTPPGGYPGGVTSYLLDPRRPLQDDLSRVARAELDAATAQLDRPPEDVHEVVHEVRKHGKKLRGLLRLVRPSLGAAYRPANDAVRDAARRLSDLRDVTSLLECVAAVAVQPQGEPGTQHLPALEERLRARRARTMEDLDPASKLRRLGEELATIRQQVATWELDAPGYAAVGPGFAAYYRRGRAAMRMAYAAPSFEAFHTWRKRAKDHRYHLELLVDTWPEVVPARREVVKHLTDLLGDAQNLAVFHEALVREPDLVPDQQAHAEVLALLGRRRDALLAEAEPLGRRVYAERPRGLRKRYAVYWDVAARA